MWYVMANTQQTYDLSDRLIRAISNWQTIVGQDDDVEQLLDQGADVNRIHGTLLPLHCACMVEDPYYVRLLLDRGAQVNALDGYGRAAIHYAAERDAECVDILLDSGALVDIADSNQDTALHWAAFKNNTECVRTLIAHGVNINIADFNLDTPLSWAAVRGNLETIKILLEHNAVVDTKNYNGQSPLVRSAIIQSTGLNTDSDDACLELLLKAQGQFDLRNPRGGLPNQIAQDNRLSDMLMPYCTNSRPLQELCRYAIRQYMGPCYMPNVAPKLPIPARLQEYVLLQR